jgi:glutamyl/glutaminyl-tRNA synthetase
MPAREHTAIKDAYVCIVTRERERTREPRAADREDGEENILRRKEKKEEEEEEEEEEEDGGRGGEAKEKRNLFLWPRRRRLVSS